MTIGRIEANIAEALKDPATRDFAGTQLETIRSAAAHADSQMVWFGRVSLLFAATFVLVSTSVLKDVEVLGSTLSDIRTVLLALPPLIALAHHRLIAQLIRAEALISAYQELIKLLQPVYYKHDLEVFGWPPTFAAEYLLTMHTRGWRRKLYRIAAAPHEFVFVYGAPLFCCYAYWRCFVQLGGYDLRVWISLVITVLALLRSLVYLISCHGLWTKP